MSSRLLLLIDEHWPARPAAPWVLLDDAGRKLSEGDSEPRHWPAARECVAVLAGSQCTWQLARLPRGARREEARLLAYALEDRLLRDPDSQHLTVTHREATESGSEVGVLVVSRERLRAVLAQLAAIGRAPVAALSELQCAPGQAGEWHLALTSGSLLVNAGPGQVQALDGPLDTALTLLQHALAGARAANQAPAALGLHLAPGVRGQPEALAPLAIEHRLADPYLWWQPVAGASNLLHGEFAPRHRRTGWASQLRWPLRLAGASLALLLAANVGEVLWMRHRLGELDQRMVRLFETSVPNTPAIAPAAQLRRQLDELRARHGRLRDDDLLTLLAAYGEARGVGARDSVATLSYREHHLELQLPALDETTREILLARLAALGFHGAGGQEATEVVISAEAGR